MERLLTLWIQDLELKNNPCATAHIKIKAKSLFDLIKENNTVHTMSELALTTEKGSKSFDHSEFFFMHWTK